jgi:sulfoxide reductase catalytic subunit YedY
VTPKQVYLNRRRFLSTLPAAGALVSGALSGATFNNLVKSPFDTDEKVTPFKAVSTYNNYYEFGTSKEDPAQNAGTLKPYPWSVKVEGAVGKPGVFSIDDIKKMAPLEERIYRHRCVEAWSIVVPWVGFSLSELIKRVDADTSKARYVAFESLWDKKQMPLGGRAGIQLPYVEGLRMDEAMHPLTLLCVGMYGDPLPNQNGAPVRIVIPWKYGFKSIKSIVRIRFMEKEPPTTWSTSWPAAYGFYSNVNPNREHPRFSQKEEQRLGEGGVFSAKVIKTQMFNGYGDQVSKLYAGMNLIRSY